MTDTMRDKIPQDLRDLSRELEQRAIPGAVLCALAASEMEDHRSELTRLRALTEWRGTESAPKDGMRILMEEGFLGGVYPVTWIGSPHNIWRRDDGGEIRKPLRWLPLPNPPKGK